MKNMASYFYMTPQYAYASQFASPKIQTDMHRQYHSTSIKFCKILMMQSVDVATCNIDEAISYPTLLITLVCDSTIHT